MRPSRIVGHSHFRCSARRPPSRDAGHLSGPATSSPPATSATATSAPPSTASPAVTVPAGWKTFTTSDGTLAFDYPEAWTIVDPAGPPADGGVFVALVSDYGKTMATLRTNMVTGAECPETLPFMVYDTEPVPALAQDGETPRFVYEGRTDPASGDPSRSLTLAYGITSGPEARRGYRLPYLPLLHLAAQPRHVQRRL